MTRRRDLEQHRHSLSEIREIMNSMKTLAYMETRKLAQFLDVQQRVIQSMENVASDFLSFYPETLPEIKQTTAVYLLIGTERGFCGDFNHALLKHLDTELAEHAVDNPLLVVVGRKLHTLLEHDERIVISQNGASVVEEVTGLLSQLVSDLTRLQDSYPELNLFCVYHSTDEIVTKRLLPPFQRMAQPSQRYPYPPVLHLAPREFLAELAEHYLFALLHEMLYTSLMAENYRRVTHLEGAVKHLDEESADLARRCNALRQEEIVEEIEVILLSSESLAGPT